MKTTTTPRLLLALFALVGMGATALAKPVPEVRVAPAEKTAAKKAPAKSSEKTPKKTPARQTTSTAIQTGKGHRFACADYSGGKVFIVGLDGKVEWEYKARHCNDLWVLPNGNLLFNTGHGVKEVTREKKIVLNYQPKSEIYSCQRLANGNTFVGDCGRGMLIELDPTGKVVKEIALLPKGKKAGHGYMRNARKLPNGNYLATHYSAQVVREYDPTGKMIREIPAPGGPHSVVRRKNGNTMIACADQKRNPMLIEVDKDNKVVWSLSNEDMKGKGLGEKPLKFLTGFHILPNGNVVFTNWCGHGQLGKAPQMFEVTREKKIVWTFQDDKTMKTHSSVQVLDVPGNALKGTIEH